MCIRDRYTTDYTPEKIQEIILEGEKTNNRSYYCRVTIQRRGSTGEYIGDLYLEEDHGKNKEDTKKDGRACRSFKMFLICECLSNLSMTLSFCISF